ncbi:MAG: FHA domain-containing protein [Chloroflexi bacterium]|nr:FHA domain-containing protein [Chloroflexota bacterium]
MRDLDSTNGTFVHGKPIETYGLRNGNEIDIGEAKLVFKQPLPAADATLGDVAEPRLRQRRPVVIVPGLMGSQLWLGGERVWPSVRRLFSEPDLFTLPKGPTLEARGLVDEVVIVPNLLEQEHYGRLTDFLCESLGYRSGVDLLEFAYDWRQYLRESARRLAQAIDTWNIEPPMILIGHSLGCMVSRYFVEQLGGKDIVSRLLLMGGPHCGAPQIVSYLFEGVELLPFGFMGERLRDVVATFPYLLSDFAHLSMCKRSGRQSYRCAER